MQFKAEDVNRIYLGQDRVCRCGCKGSYVERGEPGFERRLKRFARMWASYTPGTDDTNTSYLNLSYGNDRAMTAYFD
jgi:hypothetical protein